MTEQTDHATIETLTRDELKRQYLHWDAVDRSLTERLATMYATGKSGVATVPDERAAKAHARAAALLNGSGKAILGKKAHDGGPTESDVFGEREAVRIILRAITAKSVEASAIEAQERAGKLAPEWRAIIREWLTTAQKFAQVEARAEAFIEAAGGEAGELLPLAGWVGAGASITTQFGQPLADILAAAKAQGVKA